MSRLSRLSRLSRFEPFEPLCRNVQEEEEEEKCGRTYHNTPRRTGIRRNVRSVLDSNDTKILSRNLNFMGKAKRVEGAVQQKH